MYCIPVSKISTTSTGGYILSSIIMNQDYLLPVYWYYSGTSVLIYINTAMSIQFNEKTRTMSIHVGMPGLLIYIAVFVLALRKLMSTYSNEDIV